MSNQTPNKEWNLSDSGTTTKEIQEGVFLTLDKLWYPEPVVKEFIKRLKENPKKVALCNKCGSSNLDDYTWCYNCNDMCDSITKEFIEVDKIKELAGKELSE